MRPLTSLFSHGFSLIHVPQDETHFNPCLRQEQTLVEHLLFSALHLHLINWSLIQTHDRVSKGRWRTILVLLDLCFVLLLQIGLKFLIAFEDYLVSSFSRQCRLYLDSFHWCKFVPEFLFWLNYWLLSKSCFLFHQSILVHILFLFCFL